MNKKKHGCLTSIVVVFIILAIFSNIGKKSENTIENTVETTETTEIIETKTTEEMTESPTETSSTISEPHKDESLNGRGYADIGRDEPNYVNVIGYTAITSNQGLDIKQTDNFADESLWKIPTYIKDKQFWNETDAYLPHKTEVLVKEQYLEHKGWGNYEGYLLVEKLDDNTEYYINVNNFITKPYWTYTDLSKAAKVGDFVAEYNQKSDYYPVTKDNQKVEIPDGTKVLVTGLTGLISSIDHDNNSITATVWKEWRLGYGVVDVYFNPADLTMIY